MNVPGGVQGAFQGIAKANLRHVRKRVQKRPLLDGSSSFSKLFPHLSTFSAVWAHLNRFCISEGQGHIAPMAPEVLPKTNAEAVPGPWGAVVTAHGALVELQRLMLHPPAMSPHRQGSPGLQALRFCCMGALFVGAKSRADKCLLGTLCTQSFPDER